MNQSPLQNTTSATAATSVRGSGSGGLRPYGAIPLMEMYCSTLRSVFTSSSKKLIWGLAAQGHRKHRFCRRRKPNPVSKILQKTNLLVLITRLPWQLWGAQSKNVASTYTTTTQQLQNNYITTYTITYITSDFALGLCEFMR